LRRTALRGAAVLRFAAFLRGAAVVRFAALRSACLRAAWGVCLRAATLCAITLHRAALRGAAVLHVAACLRSPNETARRSIARCDVHALSCSIEPPAALCGREGQAMAWQPLPAGGLSSKLSPQGRWRRRRVFVNTQMLLPQLASVSLPIELFLLGLVDGEQAAVGSRRLCAYRVLVALVFGLFFCRSCHHRFRYRRLCCHLGRCRCFSFACGERWHLCHGVDYSIDHGSDHSIDNLCGRPASRDEFYRFGNVRRVTDPDTRVPWLRRLLRSTRRRSRYPTTLPGGRFLHSWPRA
jgi:hypothetical protein